MAPDQLHPAHRLDPHLCSETRIVVVIIGYRTQYGCNVWRFHCLVVNTVIPKCFSSTCSFPTTYDRNII